MRLCTIIFSLSFLFVLGLVLVRTPKAEETKKILIIHSYHPEYDWVQGVNEGLQQGLQSTGFDLDYFYMDSKRNPSQAWKVEFGKLAREYIVRSRPDLVVAVDDNSWDYAIAPLIGRDYPPIVFTGINKERYAYHYHPANITGVYEREYVHQTLNLLNTILPEINKIAYISDDSSTGKPVVERVKRFHAEGSLSVDIVGFHTAATFEEWKQLITKYELDDEIGALLIPLYHTVKTGVANAIMHPEKVMEWTVTHTTKPIVGFWPFSVKDGALAAVAVDPREHGWLAAEMVKKAMGGTLIRKIPAEINKSGFVLLNVQTAERLGIEVSYAILESCDILIE